MKNFLFVSLFLFILGSGATFAEGASVADPIQAHHDLTIRLAPRERRLEGVDRITLKGEEKRGGRPQTLPFLLNGRLKVTRVREGGRLLPFSLEADEGDPTLQWLKIVPLPSGSGEEITLEVAYEGEIFDPLKAQGSLSFVGPSQTRGMISEEGVYLPPDAGWYPVPQGEGFSTFVLAARTDPKWEVVSHDHLISRALEGEGRLTVWKTERPTPGLTLVAGPYVVQSKKVDGVTLAAYFYSEESPLSEEYLAAAVEYLKFYQALLGPYPFSVFSIVENFFPVGEGFPAFTIMGREIIKRRYTQAATLGHELVHSWLGNDVFPEEDGGNWSEGLTTYLANYFYLESKKGEEAARPLRREMRARYALYAGSRQDYPLASFAENGGPVDDAVGYRKSALVFHSLRRYLGNPLFWKGLRYFAQKEAGREAGWKEIENDFEKATGKDLGWFFQQWVHRAGAPSLHLAEIRREKEEGGYRLHITLEQEGSPYRILTPFRIEFKKGSVMKRVDSASSVTLVDWSFREEPISVEADPDQDLLRKLAPEEIPYNLNRFLADPKGILFVSDPQYDKIVEKVEGIAPKKTEARGPIPSEAGSIFILGFDPEAASLLPEGVTVEAGEGSAPPKSFTVRGKRYDDPQDAFLWSLPHPRSGQAVTFFVALSKEAIDAMAPRLFFYGGEGYVVWKRGKPVEQGESVAPKRPLKYIFRGD